jgi:hypothetical protein
MQRPLQTIRRNAALMAIAAACAPTCGFAQSGTLSVELDFSRTSGTVKDLFGVNKKPTFSVGRVGGAEVNAASLYQAFGVSQVRLHDAGVDLCAIYTPAIKQNTAVTPPQNVTGCELSGTGGIPTFTWTPQSSADADLNNPDNYDFSEVDATLGEIASTGASVYLRLGESYNGPNNTNDPVAWAKIATNIYKHVIGTFKPTPGIAINPIYVEVHNEPDGGFWRGSAADFHTLYTETVTRVRQAAAAAGKTVRIGGPGFTRSILTTSTVSGNPAKDFVNAVGADKLDFYSAHHYNNCSTATMASTGTFLRSLRTLVDSQGASGKPIHITEWNIGLGQACGNDFFAEQRTQSFASGMLTLMQDPALNIGAAHYYAGVPIMSLFDFTSTAGKAKINPSAWAFWAHTRLRGAERVSTRVCQGSTCADGHASDTLPLQALAAKSGTGHALIITNDSSTSQSYTLNISGITSATVNLSIRTPPAGVAELQTTGAPAQADSTALQTLLTSSTLETHNTLAATAGRLSHSTTIPARSLQVIDIKPSTPTLTAQADCVFSWGERNYPSLFMPAAPQSRTEGNYYYRGYETSRSYLAITLDTQDLLYWDTRASSSPSVLGPLGNWLGISHCD